MKHGSLFSGIGGFDLAAEWMGWENVFHCEWNEFGKRVLKYYWPEAESFHDVTKTDFKKYYGTIDIISGGFPCQPYSAAGKRLGKDDERHLWPEMLRAIREIAPRYVVGENVRGLTNWNGGLVFDEVCADLENLGYQVAPYIIPACGVNAPHKRERIWFIAYRDGQRSGPKHEFRSGGDVFKERVNKSGLITDSNLTGWRESHKENENKTPKQSNRHFFQYATNTDNTGLERSASERIQTNEGRTNRFQNGIIGGLGNKTNWNKFPTQSPICGGNDGLPAKLDGITFPRWRNESLKAYGNAVIPEVVYEIFKAIQSYENLKEC